MTVEPGTDLTEDRFFSLGLGLIYRVVCVPKTWDDERISKEVSEKDPPGTSANKWVVSNPDPTREGPFTNTNRVPCNDCDHRMHVMVNC